MQQLEQLVGVSDEQVTPELKDCQFQIACDVKNPLFGENGAVYVFGPQKRVKTEKFDVAC